ncbi:glycosyltransferase [Jiangella sp. DSM 45060]|uniref:glycosyltransferase n=1 Tax=Jiangella sp. DSM 45060 TaxID=1798224 RepID=UPI00087B3867|nr:glycosyltransferase [Jiangella sp. DSM 45060]SDT50603.1 sterol 3beta-glucosyltransferase [Jiangella sp. DSM 45060]
MKVLLITHGSRGDVQPFAALAKGLAEAGHTATLAAPAASAWLGKPFCDRVLALHDGPNVLADDTEVVKGLESVFRGVSGKRRLLTTIPKTRRLVGAVQDDLASMAHEMARNGGRDFDVVVHHVAGAGHDVAEFLGVPSVLMCPQPYWVPTGAFPDPSLPWPWPARFNRTSYFASRAVWWAFSGSSARWRRRSLGLGERPGGRYRQVNGQPTPVLHPFSQYLLPGPSDYPSWVHTTGFWFLPAADNWSPPAALTSFLADGPPPIYLGFASTVSSDPKRLGRIVRNSARSAGVRAVVVGGWSGLTTADVGKDILLLNDVPFDWLFRHVAAIVHHGGLGTTGAAMAAGVPQVVCPLLPDQWFSARRMQTLGIAPAPVPQRALTADALAQAIHAVLADPRTAARAAAVGELVRDENGVARAVDILETVARSGRIAMDVNWPIFDAAGTEK